ncbi:Electron transfer flavoprotein alpha/beta-subunit [Caldicellulosiruptor acetigenus I77R1B]|uniref:Electron transfer flavoprotein small subunit n=1 Tax=Caldicellulosiruptor acetigenus (strain ATCC 700853 / DSM 12137 / I77R1B) TaxID=632335 RepID=E4S758_CALA7|nr:electron transfer flavoprotein subunit beta/FixA family protein [Caldicellulosiruptor acetigenus]ADQ40722.1 Electron transfer flavoprotein alpha/beta-subunit [Caldicellulosiruptor acetigenus I77R1B]
MKILVCIKQVVDPEKVEYNAQTKTIKRNAQYLMNNPADLSALEFALRIKDVYKDVHITTLSMGPAECESKIKELIEVGCDSCVLLSDKRLAGSDAYSTAYALAKAIEKLGNFDLILCGESSLDGETSIVPPQIAEYLNIPHIAFASNIKVLDIERIEVERKLKNLLFRFEVKLPALISVKKDSAFLRLPKLSFMIKALSYTPQILSVDDFENFDFDRVGAEGSKTSVDSFVEQSFEDVKCEIYDGIEDAQIECIADLVTRFL